MQSNRERITHTIKTLAGDDGWAQVSLREFASATGIDQNAIKKMLNQMETRGSLEVKRFPPEPGRQHWNTSKYRINPVGESAEPDSTLEPELSFEDKIDAFWRFAENLGVDLVSIALAYDCDLPNHTDCHGIDITDPKAHEPHKHVRDYGAAPWCMKTQMLAERALRNQGS